jgi:hypothetical protein
MRIRDIDAGWLLMRQTAHQLRLPRVLVEYPDPPKFSDVICLFFKRFAQCLPAAGEHREIASTQYRRPI